MDNKKEATFHTSDTEYSIGSDEFHSMQDFDIFVEWAVNMIEQVHTNNTPITRIEISSIPIITTYHV